MIRHQVGFAALFALAANAFMVPSTMTLPDGQGEGIADALDSFPEMPAIPEMPDIPDMPEMPEFHIPAIPQPDIHIPDLTELLNAADGSSTFYRVTCLGCTSPSVVDFDFTVDNGRKHLLVNKHPVYPHQPGSPMVFQVAQFPAVDGRSFEGEERIRTAHYSISTSMDFLNEESADKSVPIHEAKADKRIRIFLSVDGLDDAPTPVSMFDIDLLQSADGDLFLEDALISSEPEDQEEEFVTLIEPPSHSSDCSGPAFFCDLFSYFQSKMAAWRSHIHRLRPCPGASRFHGPPPTHGGIPKFTPFVPKIEEAQENKPGYTFDDDTFLLVGGHHQHHYHHHHQHHRLRRIGLAMYNFLVGFAVPVLIGIMAGMAASLIGMVAGTAVAWIWIRFVRKGKRGPYARVQQSEQAITIDEDTLVDNDAKVRFLDSEVDADAPPVYVEKE